MAATVTVDTRALDKLGRNYERGAKVAMVRLLEQGEQYIRDEAPEQTGRLKGKRSNGGSVTSDYRQQGKGFVGEINISAINERTGATDATLHLKSGKTRTVKLRAQKPYDYAKVVATGRPRLIAPKNAKAFLIPVQAAPTGESYLVARGQVFITRRQVAETKPNDYPGRAAKRLQAKADAIVAKAVTDVLNS